MASNGVENQAYNGNGIDWSQFVHQAPTQPAAPQGSNAIKPNQGILQTLGNFIGNSASDLGNVIKGGVELPFQAIGAGIHDIKTGNIGGPNSELTNNAKTMVKGTAAEYSNFLHPSRLPAHFLEHPLNTVLDLLPFAGVAGKAASAAGAVGGAAEAAPAAEAAGAAGEAAVPAEAATVPEAANTAHTTVEQPNFFTRMRNGVAGTGPLEQDNPAAQASRSQDLQSFRGENNIKGSPIEQAYQAHEIWSDATNQLNDVISQVDKRGVTIDPRTIQNQITDSLKDTNNPGARVYQSSAGEDTKVMDAARTQVNQMIENQASTTDGQLTAKGLNTIRQQVGQDVKNWGVDASPADAMRMHVYHELSAAESQLDPAISDLVRTQGRAIRYGQSLSDASSGGNNLRVHPTGGGPISTLPIPSQSLFPAVKDIIGRVGEAATGGAPTIEGAAGAEAGVAPTNTNGPVGRVANAVMGGTGVNQLGRLYGAGVVGNEVGQQQNQQQGIQQAQANPTDLTQPAQEISQLVKQAQGNPRDNPTGYSVQDLQGMIANDMATTGGKNYANLNRLLSIATSSSKGQQLTSGAVTKITAYNSSLTALDLINKAFQSGTGTAAQQAVAQEMPAIAKAFGLSPTNKADVAQLQEMLPKGSDNAYVAQQKLAALKSQLDARAITDIQTEQGKNQAMDALMGSLSGAGATQ